MPKVLITESCLVNYGDDKGGKHADATDVVDCPKADALALVHANRALYCAKEDDPYKGKFTATADMLKAAEAIRTARAKAAANKGEA